MLPVGMDFQFFPFNDFIDQLKEKPSSFFGADKTLINPFIKLLKSDEREEFADEIFNGLKKIAEISSSNEERSQAAFICGMIYLYGLGAIEKNITEALNWLSRSDEPYAAYVLGISCFQGKGVEKNVDLGKYWLKVAAERGSTPALCALGTIYWHQEEGHKVNRTQAEEYMNKVISKNYSYSFPLFSQKVKDFISEYAVTHLSDRYQERELTKIVPEVSPELKEGMYNRIGIALTNLGCEYLAMEQWKHITDARQLSVNGNEIQTTDKIAQETLCHLGRVHYADINEKKAKSQAVAYWTQAAKADHVLSQYYLGLAYCSGQGVKKNLEEGKRWLQQAADQNLWVATAMLNHLEGKNLLKVPEMPEGENLNLAQKEAEDCIYASKPFLQKVWKWLKDHKKDIRAWTITAIAISAIIAGLVALTIFFPHVMIPIWLATGGAVVCGVGLVCAFFLLFGVGGH